MPARGLAGAALVVALAVAGCEDPDHPAFNHYQGGSRLDDRGGLVVWLGDECHGVTSVRVDLEREDVDTSEAWVIRSKRRSGASLSALTLGVVPDSFREVDPLRGEWRDADDLGIVVGTRTSQTASYLIVPEFLEEAEERPPDEWFVQDHGWFTQDEYAEELVGADNADIYPTCTTRD